MIRHLIATLVLLSLPTLVQAEGRTKLGYGRLITNDYIGDGRDRWQSGSVTASRVYGRGWDGALPEEFGDIIELRLNAQIVAPDDLTNPAAGDRPYGGVLSFGAHTHYARGKAEIALGADLAVTGPQTGLTGLQDGIHDTIGVAKTSAATRAAQIRNGVHPSVVVEVARNYALGNAQIRPFVEGRLGLETVLRAGVDMTFGSVTQGELLVRDPITGTRYRVIERSAPGYAFVIGADIAKVDDSILLPKSRGYTLSDTRQRVRAGLHWQGKKSSGFYGLTYLNKEFVGQGSGQVLGSVRLNLKF